MEALSGFYKMVSEGLMKYFRRVAGFPKSRLKEYREGLLIGHVGKMLKLAQGIMNTHSRYGDGRTTFLAMEAMFAGACVR